MIIINFSYFTFNLILNSHELAASILSTHKHFLTPATHKVIFTGKKLLEKMVHCGAQTPVS